MTAARPDGDGLARPSADWPLVAVHALLLAGYAVGRQNLMRPTDTHGANLLAPAC